VRDGLGYVWLDDRAELGHVEKPWGRERTARIATLDALEKLVAAPLRGR
jgi:hypothetical protein